MIDTCAPATKPASVSISHKQSSSNAWVSLRGHESKRTRKMQRKAQKKSMHDLQSEIQALKEEIREAKEVSHATVDQVPRQFNQKYQVILPENTVQELKTDLSREANSTPAIYPLLLQGNQQT